MFFKTNHSVNLNANGNFIGIGTKQYQVEEEEFVHSAKL
jgi:hypothetical protein